MKTRFLFPYWSRYAGLVCIVIHLPIMLVLRHMPDHINWDNGGGLFTNSHIFFIATTLMVTVGLFLVAFSKERIEDEQIVKLRRDSLYWAIFINYLILIVVLVFTNGMEFNHIMQLNMWAPLLFFIIRFRWVIFRLNQSLNKEV